MLADWPPKAIDAYEQAIMLEPDNAPARFNLAEVHLLLGKRDAVLKQYAMLKNTNAGLAKQLYEILYSGRLLNKQRK